jgi:hypothetical protein
MFRGFGDLIGLVYLDYEGIFGVAVLFAGVKGRHGTGSEGFSIHYERSIDGMAIYLLGLSWMKCATQISSRSWR